MTYRAHMEVITAARIDRATAHLPENSQLAICDRLCPTWMGEMRKFDLPNRDNARCARARLELA